MSKSTYLFKKVLFSIFTAYNLEQGKVNFIFVRRKSFLEDIFVLRRGILDRVLKAFNYIELLTMGQREL